MSSHDSAKFKMLVTVFQTDGKSDSKIAISGDAVGAAMDALPLVVGIEETVDSVSTLDKVFQKLHQYVKEKNWLIQWRFQKAKAMFLFD